MTAERVRTVALYAVAGAILAYMLLPLLLVFPMSLTSGNTLQFPIPGTSWRWYRELVADGRWIAAFEVSVVVASASTAAALVLGVPAAIALAWTDFAGKRLVWAMLATPIVMPVVIVGVASYFFFSKVGLVGNRLSIVLVHTAMAVPVVVSMVVASLSTFDRTLMRASASLGAGVWRSFYEILLPLIGPGVATGAIIAFTISFDEVVVASFLSVGADRTLPRMIFSGVRESVSPAIAAVAVCLMILSGLLLAAYGLVQSRAARLASRPSP